ncbi:hypothetical protein NCAS_0A02460 [Naumovozyma castellii]|uniref:DNA repair protein RAD59 n=1 Tax=Naumovozyma castellii TaxID=27288 RepID=G0V5R6_NAUCA|nr:hypothetical protein NCAS_0A02460 [Naumovozyma castellii CBS 4309]CCC66804.1 hypothetical protein NCAS_0A02460 [Naumovozyma castellii CBS 4309]
MNTPNQNHISYEGTVYTTSHPSLSITDFKIEEDWNGRPASEWSVSKIGLLQSKIEKYTYKIYHSNRFGKHNLSKLIPRHKLVEFANEVFGFDGWHVDVIEVDASEMPPSSAQLNVEDDTVKHTVLAEAQVKITLKDGTNTQMGGIGKATMNSKGDSFSKARKEAVNDALKKALLSFEKIILEYETKVENNYYVDGLYVTKIKQENTHVDDLGFPIKVKKEQSLN